MFPRRRATCFSFCYNHPSTDCEFRSAFENDDTAPDICLPPSLDLALHPVSTRLIRCHNKHIQRRPSPALLSHCQGYSGTSKLMSAALATQRLDKGKQPDCGVFDQHHEPIGNRDNRHRAYHMQMVEHARNNALSLLNAHFCNPSIDPSANPLNYAFKLGHHALGPKGGFDRDDLCGLALSSVLESTVGSTLPPLSRSTCKPRDVPQVGVDPVDALSPSSSPGARRPAQLSASGDNAHPALRNSKPCSSSNNQGYSRPLDAFSGTSSSSLANPFHSTQQLYPDVSSGHAPLQADPALVLAHSELRRKKSARASR